MEAAKKLVDPKTPPSQRGSAATDLLINAVMSHGLAHGLVKGGELPDASKEQSTAPVGQQPGGAQGAGAGGGQGVGPGDQGTQAAGAGQAPPEAAPEVPLKPTGKEIGDHIGATYDGLMKMDPSKPGFQQFTWRDGDVDKSDPHYGATFYVPEGASLEQAMAKAKSQGRRVRRAGLRT